MPRTSPDTPRIERPEALLGAGHPLVAVLAACGATAEAVAAVAVAQLGAFALWWASASYARALALAAALVQVALGMRWADLRVRRRELCLDLLIAGRGDLPLAALRRERRRLGNPRYQVRLAGTLEDVAAQRAGHRALYSGRLVAAMEPQLRDVASTLRAGEVNVRGAALLERLITSGGSPLYGEEVAALRDELARARYLLA